MAGGGATKGMLYVSQQPAEGYEVLAVTTSHLIDAVKPKTRSHILRDFDPLMRIQWDTSAVTISGDSKFKTLTDLVEYGKKKPEDAEVCRDLARGMVGDPDGRVLQEGRAWR